MNTVAPTRLERQPLVDAAPVVESKMPLDPADFNVISGALASVAGEMGDIMLRSAYSTIVREAKDFSTCVMDGAARTVAQAEMIPIHMNSMAAAVDWMRQKYDFSAIKPTEAFLTNNPYERGQHLNDIILVMPVFFDGELVAFAGSVCHHLELGGAMAGSNVKATDLYQEGLIIPTMKIDIERDLGDGPVEQMLRANVRIPKVIIGDFHAQVSAVLRGRQLLQDLFERHGAELLQSCMSEMQDYAERIMRGAISALPDGTYYGEDVLDGQTLGGTQPTVRSKVVISGDEAVVDLSESDDQVGWPVNSPVASTESAVLTIFRLLCGPDVPTNAGTYRPISVITRLGSILDPRHPAPLRGRMTSAYRTGTAVKRALSAADPTRFSAAGSDSTNSISMSRRGPMGYEMFTELLSGGNGAGPRGDGAEAIAQMLSNTANTPVESTEMDYEFVRIVQMSLVPDSGGPGTYRGGLGYRRVYEILADDVVVSTNGDRHDSAPWGLVGGGAGSRSSYCVVRGDVETRVPAASISVCNKGDEFIVNVAGGGGYGDPKARAREAVADDLRCGRVSSEMAAEVYGYAEDPS
jgi:N-methylhydantoinase B